MIDLQTSPKPLQELATLLAIPSPPSSDIPKNKMEEVLTKVVMHPAYYGNYHQESSADSLNKKIELIVPSDTDFGSLFRFIVNVDKEFKNDSGLSEITKMIPFRGQQGTVITIRTRDAEVSNTMTKLAHMFGVKKVEEEALVIADPPSFSNKDSDLLTSNINHNKKICVSLASLTGTDITRRELVPVLA
ncbi:hypothetical protein ACFLW0_04780 [Chloroflexota bacterium]